MNPYMKINYYTFQEVLDLYPQFRPEYPHSTDFEDDWFSKILASADLELAIYGVSEVITDDIIKDVIDALMTIVYQRHSEHFIYWKEMRCEDSYSLNTSDFHKYIRTLLTIIELTTPKYLPLLQDQEYYSYAPTSPLKSKTTGRTRFNDTPQDEGEWNDEEHATNVSKSVNETEVDSGSIVSRLNEAFKEWRSIILEWANEFDQAFLLEEQI